MERELAQYLQRLWPQAKNVVVSGVDKRTEGFSYQTILFDAAWRERGQQRQRGLVVRMEPRDPIAVGPCRLPEQFAILTALHGSNVPVPRPVALETDPSVLGAPFIIVDRVTGEVPIPWGADVADAAARLRMADRFVEVLARIHAFDWRRAGLSRLLGNDAARRIDPAAREIKRWEHVVDTLSLRPEPILREALLWCKRNKPKPDRISLTHGDYRLGNFIWKDGDIQAFLDWEIAGIGDPMADVGWISMYAWRDRDPTLWTGLIDRPQFIALYERHSGHSVDEERVFFWEVLGNVHMACIVMQCMWGFERGGLQDLRLVTLEEYFYRPVLHELTKILQF
jgi:aminoglycoside phosphotransferase (APT) family kinase protein